MARSISHIGDGIALLALILYVKDVERSGVAVGSLLLAGSVPRFFGPFAGVLADRVEQRLLMIACDVGRAAIFTAIAWLQPSFPPLLALVVATSFLDTVFEPAGRSAVPALVEPPDLLQANAWIGTAANLQVAVGPFVGGVLVSLFGARGGLAANALTFLASAALLVGLPSLRAPEREGPRGFLAEGKEGLEFAWRDPVLRAVLLALFFGVAFAALDNVALVFLVRDSLGAGALAFGIVSGAFGVGMMVGSFGLSWVKISLAATSLFLAGWLLSGVGTLFTGLVPAVALATFTQALAGLGNGVSNIAGDTLVQQVVPRPMLGRVFGLVSTAAFGGSTVAYAVGGFLIDLTSPRVVFLVAGLGVLGVLLLIFAMFRNRERGRSA